MSKKALEENLNNIPSKNFDIKKMLKNGLIEKVAGITKEDFNKLSDKEKKSHYFCRKIFCCKI